MNSTKSSSFNPFDEKVRKAPTRMTMAALSGEATGMAGQRNWYHQTVFLFEGPLSETSPAAPTAGLALLGAPTPAPQ